MKLRAIIKRPDEEVGHVTNISTSLENLQKIVGGYIETVTIHRPTSTRPDIVIVCDEEGRLKGKEFCCSVMGITFVGEIIVLGVNQGDDDFCDCDLTLKEWMAMIQ